MAKRRPIKGLRRWYKKSHRIIHEVEDLANEAFDLLFKTGETTPLLAFCDLLAEREENKPFEERLRAMVARDDLPAILFFMRQGGVGYDPKLTTYAEAAVRAALNLRGAELWFKENEYPSNGRPIRFDEPHPWLRFRWDFDVDYDPMAYDGPMPWCAFVCTLERWEQRRGDGDIRFGQDNWLWYTIGSLGGITFAEPHDDPHAHDYHLVVQADLALEAMPLVVNRETDPGKVFNCLLLTDWCEGNGILATVESWTDDQRAEAHNWAIREHLAANDNDVERVKCPDFVNVLRRVV